jgi:hypothetical protein
MALFKNIPVRKYSCENIPVPISWKQKLMTGKLMTGKLVAGILMTGI